MPRTVAEPSHASRTYAQLHQKLVTGAFAIGEKLPTLRALMDTYDEPYQSVRQAILRLEHDGLVIARHGSGTYALEIKARTRTVLLITQSGGDEWSELVRGFMDRFSMHEDVRLMVESIPGATRDRLAAFGQKLSRLIDGGLDAVLIHGFHGADEYKELFKGKVPTVVFYSSEWVPNFRGGTVLSDWHHGGYAGMRHLIETGCRDVVLLVPHLAGDVPRDHHTELARGCRTAIADSTRPIRLRIIEAMHDDPTSEPRLLEMIRAKKRPDAIFAHADFRAAPLIPLIQREGLRVPRDIAVLGYYDTPWTMVTQPRLSSISTRPQEIAGTVADLFFQDRMNDRIVIPPRLIVRGSTQG